MILLRWVDQIGEAAMAVGIIALAAIFHLGDGDPIKRIQKVPMCRVTCSVVDSDPHSSHWDPAAMKLVCDEKTEEVWNDFIEREVAKDPHNYCGACGTPVDCEKVRYR